MAEGFLPPITAVLKANILEFQEKMHVAQKEMATTGTKMSQSGKGMSQGVGIAMGVIGAAAVEVGVHSIHMADKFEEAHARLEIAVKNSHGNMEEFNHTLDNQGKKFEHLGYNNTTYQNALSMLIPAVGNTARAIDLMKTAADLAAARHMDLEKAAIMVGKAASGNTAVFKKMGIDLGLAKGGVQALHKAQDKYADALKAYAKVQDKVKAGDLTGRKAVDALKEALDKVKDAQDGVNKAQSAGKDAVDALGKKFGGSAKAQAETFAGKMKELHAKLDDVQTKIGLKLIPVLINLEEKFVALTDWYQDSAVPWLKGFGAKLDDLYEEHVFPFFHSFGEKIGDFWAQSWSPFWQKAGAALDDFGNKWMDTWKKVGAGISDANKALGDSMNMVGHGVADVFNLGDKTMSSGDKKKMWLAHDAQTGRAPGTTEKMYHDQNPGKALGGIGSYPAAGAYELLHGKEAILPLNNMPAARRIAQQAGVFSGGEGGVHVHGDIHLTVVSPDPDRAGADVHRTLTDAQFLMERG